MTTAATSTPVSMANDAAFQAWYNEQITQLAAVGLTQTSDTGQISGSASRPSANSAAGYTIWRFNDTLQSTAPIFIKLEFGAGATVATQPQMWITMGTSTNGAGTLSGSTTRVAVLNGVAPASNVTNYTSRWCYSAAAGYLAMSFKMGSTSTNTTLGAFFVLRGNNSSGAPAGDAAILLTGNTSATGGSTNGAMQCWSYANSLVYPTLSSANSILWPAVANGNGIPFSLTATLNGSNAYVTPCYYVSPIPTISSLLGFALLTEAAQGTTISCAIIGSVAHTFISIGQPFGSINQVGSLTAATTIGMLMLWE